MTREDIESFGFRYDKPIMSFHFFEEEEEKQIGDLYYHDDLNIMLGHYPHSNRIGISTIDPAKNDYFAKWNRDNFAIGSLRIETREEMKFIMDRLPKK